MDLYLCLLAFLLETVPLSEQSCLSIEAAIVASQFSRQFWNPSDDPDCRKKAKAKRIKQKLADEAEMERQQQDVLKEQDECRRLLAEQHLTQPATEESETSQVSTAAAFCHIFQTNPEMSPLSDGLPCLRKAAEIYQQLMTSKVWHHSRDGTDT